MTKQNKLRHSEYYDLQDCFDELYAKSKQGDVFTNLMEVISSEENIRLAYRNIKHNSGSYTSGVDKLSIKDIERLSTEKLVEIIQRKFKFYKPKPVKRVEIPKPNGNTRPLGIPTIVDRLVQQCILQVLEPICEAKFHERSNGFRPNRSAEHALAQCYRMIQIQNLHFAVDVDIKGFFDNVNHSKLIRQMWALGIRDKQLICIIKEMLKAPVAMPDGSTQYPTKGTPQGGILSPLLANIVLNELDWWISSQWENMITHSEYQMSYENGTANKNNVYRALRNSRLKEMYMVRYADDFKIFCRKRSDADKAFIAVKQWLKDRLSLEISDEKSKVVNLKKHYSEFLGFKMKVVRKGKKATGQAKYAVQSHMSDKSKARIKKQAVEAMRDIKHLSSDEQKKTIVHYNSLVMGWHNYYKFATHVSRDFSEIAFLVKNSVRGKLENQLKKSIVKPLKSPVYIHYAQSKEIRYLGNTPIVPIAYVQHKNPMDKKRIINKYTVAGRAEIHKRLEKVNVSILHYLMRHPADGSIEYNDNRLSLYCAQQGKCAVLNVPMETNRIHCHHKIPKARGGNDAYGNLILVDKSVHSLIHAIRKETIENYKEILNLSQKQVAVSYTHLTLPTICSV